MHTHILYNVILLPKDHMWSSTKDQVEKVHLALYNNNDLLQPKETTKHEKNVAEKPATTYKDVFEG